MLSRASQRHITYQHPTCMAALVTSTVKLPKQPMPMTACWPTATGWAGTFAVDWLALLGPLAVACTLLIHSSRLDSHGVSENATANDSTAAGSRVDLPFIEDNAGDAAASPISHKPASSRPEKETVTHTEHRSILHTCHMPPPAAARRPVSLGDMHARQLRPRLRGTCTRT